ncbi:MAG: WYL domain-containing protein [Alphaproteobacteria bacterium]|nr:WYL domain-containing protein [Alphaproteobacteria bacterium]
MDPRRGPARDLFSLPLREAPIAALDLEMTGLSPKGDRVCEIAVVTGEGGRVHREFQTLVHAGVPMSEGARKCHGISEHMLVGAPIFAEIAGDVVSALRDVVVVAHNVDFDLGFLHREFDGSPVVLPPPVTLDTLLMARRLFAFRRNGLVDACAELGVELRGVHRALSDARACFDLFYRMAELLDPHGEVTVRDLNDLIGALAPNSPLRLQQQQVLRDAFRERRSVWLDVQSTSDPIGGTIRREVDLWFLRLPRLQGYCHLRQAERVFRLDRIRHVALGDRTYEIPEDAVSRV